MKLPALAIRNYQFILILVLLGLLVGINSFVSMPRSEDPNTKFPIFSIIVVYPGTSPEDMEDLVVEPIEEAIEEVELITKVNTTITDGVAVFQVESAYGIDIDDKYDELVAELNIIRDQLPDGLYSFDINKVDPTERTTIRQLALVSPDAPFNKLHSIAEDLQFELEQIKGLKKIEINAYPEEQIRIALDFPRMAQQNISLGQVRAILQGNNLNIPGGDIDAGSKTFNIKSSGAYSSLEEISATVISAREGRIVKLGDIAEVRMDYEDQRWLARYKGSRALFVNIYQQGGENILQLNESIDGVIASFNSKLPQGIALETGFEQAPAVRTRIADFFINLMQGILLVGLIILIFLGWRPSLIIMTVIPISILVAIAALDYFGFALQQISIAALVIALGLLVDNGIVVIENVVRFRKLGYPLKEAAAKGTAEVGFAVVASTATTVLAFFPLALMQSGPGEFLKSLPVTVMLVLFFSLILALTFTPILAGRFLKEKKVKAKPGRFSSWMETVITRLYRPLLHFGLKRPWVIIGISVLTFVGSLMLFPSIGVSFFPTADKPVLLIEVDSPEGSSLASTDAAVRYVEQVLDTTDFVASYMANVGHGNPRIYYNRIPKQYNKAHGQLLVNFEQWDPARFYETLRHMRREFSGYPGAKITFSELKNGPPFKAPVEIKVLGENTDSLRVLAARVEQIISATEGTLNVNNPLALSKTNLAVHINQDKAGMLGLSVPEIDLAVRASLAGLEIGETILPDGDSYPMVIRMPFGESPSVEDFYKVYFSSRAGAQIPLRQVADLHFEPTVNEILHFNMQKSTSVTADVYNADATAQITEQIIAQLDQIRWPQGYRYYVAGEYETQQESFGDLGKLLLVAMIGIFAVLVLQFRSIKQPLIVFSAIPLAITGSFVALFLTGWSFSFFAFVGFISLVGIVVNNSIILVDYSNQLMREGVEKVEALKQAAETRFTPILLTTTTTILGLLPLTLQSTSLWSPLGWTIIGGMISSTFLTLMVVPILYKWFTTASAVAPKAEVKS